jgi:hypothetical protein
VKLTAAGAGGAGGDATATLTMDVFRAVKAGEHNADAYAAYVKSVEQFIAAVEPYLVLEKAAK